MHIENIEKRISRSVLGAAIILGINVPAYAQTTDGAGLNDVDAHIEDQLQNMQVGEEISDLSGAEIGYAGRAPWIGSDGIGEFDYAFIMRGKKFESLVFQTDCVRLAFQQAGTYNRTLFPGFAVPHQRLDRMDIIDLVPAVTPVIPVTEVEQIDYRYQTWDCTQISAKDDLVKFGKKIVKYLPAFAEDTTRTVIGIGKAIERARNEPDPVPDPTLGSTQ